MLSITTNVILVLLDIMAIEGITASDGFVYARRQDLARYEC